MQFWHIRFQEMEILHKDLSWYLIETSIWEQVALIQTSGNVNVRNLFVFCDIKNGPKPLSFTREPIKRIFWFRFCFFSYAAAYETPPSKLKGRNGFPTETPCVSTGIITKVWLPCVLHTFQQFHLGSVPQQSIADAFATATNAGARIGWRAKGGRWQRFATKATRIRGWRPFRNLLDTPEVEQLDPEKLWLVGRRLFSYWGPVTFPRRAVKLREGIDSKFAHQNGPISISDHLIHAQLCCGLPVQTMI